MLCTSAAIKSVDKKVEVGFTLYVHKGQSLVNSSIYHSTNAASNYGSTDKNVININNFWIERDMVIISDTKVGSFRNRPMDSRTYCVIGFYDKHNNKWFMLGENNLLGSLLKPEEKNRYKVALHMVDFGIME